jgi:hypothetical protein
MESKRKLTVLGLYALKSDCSSNLYSFLSGNELNLDHNIKDNIKQNLRLLQVTLLECFTQMAKDYNRIRNPNKQSRISTDNQLVLMKKENNIHA